MNVIRWLIWGWWGAGEVVEPAPATAARVVFVLPPPNTWQVAAPARDWRIEPTSRDFQVPAP